MNLLTQHSPRPFIRAALLWLSVGFGAVSLPAYADVDFVSVIWHNDLFVGKDGGGYTNGAFISWYDVSDIGQKTYKPAWPVRPFVGSLIKDEGAIFTVNAYTLGQAMITPQDISVEVPDPNDAPYAGLLFVRAAYISVFHNYADMLSITAGIVGPSSGADETQRFIHRVTGSTDPKGWDYQIKDEPVAQIERARIWRFGFDGSSGPVPDVVVVGGVSLGNLESALGGAVLLRYGTGLEKSFATAAQLTGRITNPMAIQGGWNVYLGAGVEYVHNQIFVNGNTFRDSPSGDLRHEQYSVMAGVSYSWSRFSATLALSDGNALDKAATARERFGSLTLAWSL